MDCMMKIIFFMLGALFLFRRHEKGETYWPLHFYCDFKRCVTKLFLLV
jgi:hypothetical protein